MAKKFTLELSTAGIDSLINEIDLYERTLDDKLKRLRERVTEEIRIEAEMNFAGATMDDIIGGGWRNPDVSVLLGSEGNVNLVIAQGEDAVFVEFGAGVYHNGAVGSSPHPNGAELGMTIGSYGKGFGARKAWGYYENGGLVLTRGTAASMPMYSALKSVLNRIDSIAREVFGN